MTHAPPVPEGNQSPYPIAEPPHAKTPPTERRDHAHRAQGPDAGLIAGLAAGAIAALGAVGLVAYMFTRRNDRSPVTLKSTGRAVRRPAARRAAAGSPKAAPSKPATRKTGAAKTKPRASTTRAGTGDDPSIRGPRDASRIAMGEPHEVAYWTSKLGVDKVTLQAAVDAVGNGARAVTAQLGKA